MKTEIQLAKAAFAAAEPFMNMVLYISSRPSAPLPMTPAIWYNLGQALIYTVMAVGIMRLKLFLTPHLCIVIALLAKDKVPS